MAHDLANNPQPLTNVSDIVDCCRLAAFRPCNDDKAVPDLRGVSDLLIVRGACVCRPRHEDGSPDDEVSYKLFHFKNPFARR
jgi:hypothetical protein